MGAFEQISQFDLKVFQWFEDVLWNPVLDFIMALISFLGEDGILFIALIVVLLCFKKTRKIGITMGAALLLMQILNNMVFKEIIARPRPFNYEGYVDFNYPNIAFFGKIPTSFSFPSGHTSSAFTCATAMFANNKKAGIGMYVFAVLMGISRIYLHDHYFSDVLCGMLFGILYGVAGYCLGKWVYEKGKAFIEKKKAQKAGQAA